ncbi:ABC transporter ATP-binding protein [Parablautia sp. Marseille-Q6255]|uniref:ABC transporter ATP-binding protein n=1 Tax=Parablautia sp. Marseille-Q6255 TaxID=3039593 RepID=UPI0024BC5007|nr:ABC transporter ATP-binding protein [Parablautia sp. Marseille-Q6255]
MLKVNNIDVYYDKVQALFGVSIEVHQNEVISIIGSNGAGKSTLMKTIMGLNNAKKGTIEFEGERIDTVKAHSIVGKGIVYVPEGREIFPDMSVIENLEMGAFSKNYTKEQMNQKMQEAYDLFPRLYERRNQLAGTMSGGEQQMLAISRGLMSDPKLIMFDEPSLGLAPVLVDEMFEAIVRINKEKKKTVIIVEQNAFMAISISDRCYVLRNGLVTMEGESKELLGNDEVNKSYLGG